MLNNRYLIVNADDFGRSPGLNRGIIEAYEKGIVTSASLMVRWPAAKEAASYVLANPRLGLGLHLDFGEWIVRDHAWVMAYEIVPMSDASAVDREIARQVEAFLRLTGMSPTHLDSHQHTHLEKTARPIVERWGCRLGVPVRLCDPAVRYCGGFYGQTEDGEPLPGTVSAQNLLRLLEALPSGWTEIACHPGFADDLETDYREPRRMEVAALCDRSVREALTRLAIRLRSFADYPRADSGGGRRP